MVPVSVLDMTLGLEFSHTKFEPPVTRTVFVLTRRGVKQRTVRVRQRRDTLCRILQVHSEQGGALTSYTEISRGLSSCSPLDNFCYETGRLNSLDRAIRNARVTSEHFKVTDQASYENVKAIESAIFLQYLRRGKNSIEKILFGAESSTRVLINVSQRQRAEGNDPSGSDLPPDAG